MSAENCRHQHLGNRKLLEGDAVEERGCNPENMFWLGHPRQLRWSELKGTREYESHPNVGSEWTVCF